MKRKTAAVLLITLMCFGLIACGQGKQNAQSSQISNPWRSITETQANEICPDSFRAPEGAENVSWSMLESMAAPSGIPGPLVQMSFDLYGNRFTAREQVTGNTWTEAAGMNYEWTVQDDIVLNNWGQAAGKYYRFIGENEYADLCIWYQPESGVSYSVSVSAKDLDGFDLQAVAEMLNPLPATDSIPGMWQTVSMRNEDDGTISPEYLVRFKDSEIQYGHLKDGEFVFDYSDPILFFEQTEPDLYKVKAEAVNGVKYTYRTCETDQNVLEYYETWEENDFSEMYRGGASLSRCN